MKLSLLEIALWAVNSVLNVVLLLVLFLKGRWRIVPWFTTWIGYGLFYALACFLDYRLGSKESYRVVYWVGALGDFLLQIAVIAEIARSALKREGNWVEGAKKAILPFLAFGPILAAGLATWITPAASNVLDGLASRASLFSTVLVCFLFVAVVRATQNLGLDWRSYIARESFGLTVWTLAAFVIDSLHAYWRTMGHFGLLENTRNSVYQGVLLFWCIAFWLPEPETPIMPARLKDDYQRRIQR
ncbi:hypothetical protein Terro_2933 [Terriglobus roseus DSM 18391]|uniref:Uncharacterized protein n=1 Tax=Terriglobus roseus (strain DSM 18391 / NRRL B-41598 / KBS 63) TaxID=926566 RepID=I3ZIV0_TERRK|nr:hypothetical protein [Terriglobus roseus]AFL89168.1 hypothetical protein Terro_2933 [Terriglobus roseus DSM 18391]